jgi:hypothetical protein
MDVTVVGRIEFRHGAESTRSTVWLGHHSPALTLAVYTHRLSGDLPDVDLLEGGNTGATSPAETSRNGDGSEEAQTRIAPSSSSAGLEVQSVS